MDHFEEIIKQSTILIHKNRYAYIKTKETTLNNHFLIAQDKEEITIITEEKNLAKQSLNNPKN